MTNIDKILEEAEHDFKLAAWYAWEGDKPVNVAVAWVWCEELLKTNLQALIAQEGEEIKVGLEEKSKHEFGHGSYHCGFEECCGKLTKKKQQEIKLADANCEGFNEGYKRGLREAISIISNRK